MAKRTNFLARWLTKSGSKENSHMASSSSYVPDAEAYRRGSQLGESWRGIPVAQAGSASIPADTNPLWDYFSKHHTGPGIWKWQHYFDIYHRHLAQFRNRRPTIVEVGVYSGGSLGMWQNYFGDGCKIHGVDIEKACKCYESKGISIHIGDQEDRDFWLAFREQVGPVDVLIDDGGHTPEQQMVTLEEILPYMPPGSVYICEDVHRVANRFADFAAGLISQLNAQNRIEGSILQATTTPLQQSLASIHVYPYVYVIEKHTQPPSLFISPKQGTQWQPFYDR